MPIAWSYYVHIVFKGLAMDQKVSLNDLVLFTSIKVGEGVSSSSTTPNRLSSKTPAKNADLNQTKEVLDSMLSQREYFYVTLDRVE
jgi:hypothetical protein